MRTKTAKSKTQAIRDYLAKHPAAKAATIVKSFDVSFPYAYTVIKKVKEERMEWEHPFPSPRAYRVELEKIVPSLLPMPMLPAEVEDEEGNFPSEVPIPVNALNVQVSGDHYKSMKIQPVQFITANNLSFLEGCIVKRISRWRSKDGLRDLEKIKHEVDLLIELEGLK
jgi:hypothetical protein